LHPAKHGKFIERLADKEKKKGMKISEKKTSKNICRFKISFLLLHPLCNTSETKLKHVRRHIELTAVLREISKQKNKSNGIERFEKNR